MAHRFLRVIGCGLAAALAFGGCGAPPPEHEAPGSLPAAVGEPGEGFQQARIEFPEDTVGYSAGETPPPGADGALPPTALCGETARTGGELVSLELVLPASWTARAAEEGEGVYADMLCGPVNLYADGECVGTAGYSRFSDEPLEQWDEYGFSQPPLDYQGYYRWLMTGPRSWDNGYTPVVQGENACAAVCRVRYPAELLGTEEDVFNPGILYYDRELLYYAAIELREGAVTDGQLRKIAESVRLSARERPFDPPLPVPSVETPEGCVQTDIRFPAYQEGREDCNAAVYETPPFLLRLALPEGWTVRKPAQAASAGGFFTPMELWDGEKQAGSAGFMTFEIVGPTTEENFHRMVYNQLMLGSVANWDNDYTPVTLTETTCTATCRVMHKADGPEWEGVSMAGRPELYNPAILSYDEKLLVYVALSFEEGAVTDEQLETIARSVRLLRAES